MQPAQANMISVNEAKQLIDENSTPLGPCIVSLINATGLLLAKDIYAAVNIPAFPQSGMDGYALAFASIGKPIVMAGEQAAGNNLHPELKTATAVRIFTGAVIPDGADTVVIQEKAKVVEGFLQIEDDNLKKGDNVRLQGSEIAIGELALRKGATLTAPAIGFLAGMGTTLVEVIPNPRVSIIVTGNELQDPGTTQEYGKVYESSSFALRAALKQLLISEVDVYQSADNIDMLTRILKEVLTKSDIVLMTGGVSVGDYDFTVKASENCGVKKIFHKIKQKPGKPIFFGTKENVLFFGLPGNPSSVLTCFYEYVIPAIGKLSAQPIDLEIKHTPIATAYNKPEGFTHFLKGIFDGAQVHLPPGQESYKLNSFARSNCLVKIPNAATRVLPGDLVEIHLLP